VLEIAFFETLKSAVGLASSTTVKEVIAWTTPPSGSKIITRQSPRLDVGDSVNVALPFDEVIGVVWTAMKRALDQMTLQPGVAPVNFAQTVRSVSWTLKSVFDVVQSLANVATVVGAA
jgi:hypothetical protein